MKNISTDVIRRIYDNNDGRYVEVGPDGDGLGVEIRTTGENIEYFGKINLTLSAEMAKELGRALMLAADEAMRETKCS